MHNKRTKDESIMNHTEITTIRDFIRFATSTFNQSHLYFGHGTDNAWDEAVALTLHTLHLPHHINPAILDAHLIQEERKLLFTLIEKRVKEKVPVPYLTHEAWFANLSFYVDERVLIPRSPIAELINSQFSPWINYENVSDILDLCTGSGCIAVACAKTFPHAQVDASDISADALAVAKINLLRHEVDEEVTLYQSDLFDNLPNKQYDIIVSNPPYVSEEEMLALPEEYHHEPKLGLAAGKEGLDFVTTILHSAYDYLKPHGILIVEVGNSETALAQAFPHIPFTWLSFEHGGGGVFLLTKEELKKVKK